MVDVYAEGYKAYEEGLRRTDNPYSCDRSKWYEWYRGWKACSNNDRCVEGPS